MEQTSLELPEIILVGISIRTSYEQELDKMNGNIFPCVRHYFHQRVFDQIPFRKKPGSTFCAYTDYESDHKGSYTYFIGEEVFSIDGKLPAGLQSMKVPKQRYVKFTNGPAAMPDVIVKAWEEIRRMPPEKLGGKKAYKTDFEIYDERAADHQNIILDIYVGVE